MSKSKKVKTESTSGYEGLKVITSPLTKNLYYDDDIIEVRMYPSFIERHRAVVAGTEIVFETNEDGEEEFIASAVEFARRYAVLACYTNIDFQKLGNDLWTIVNYSPLYEDTVEIVGEGEVNDFIFGLDSAIDFKLERICNPLSAASTAIVAMLDRFITSMSDGLKDFNLGDILEKLATSGSFDLSTVVEGIKRITQYANTK